MSNLEKYLVAEKLLWEFTVEYETISSWPIDDFFSKWGDGANAINNAFPWKTSLKGAIFWDEINLEFLQYLEDIKNPLVLKNQL